MRIFASDRVKGLMQRLGMEKGQAIEASLVSKSIENAQRKVEAHNYDIRKHVLEYDDVANDQRKVVYAQRSDLLESDDISEMIGSIRFDVVDQLISKYIPPESVDEQWDIPGLEAALKQDLGLELPVQQWLADDKNLHEETLRERIQEIVQKAIAEKEELIGAPNMRQLERNIMLQVLDTHWKEHLAAMDYLRQGIGLRGYAQKNPKQEYKREAFDMFEQLLDRIKHDVISFLARIQIGEPQPEPAHADPNQMNYMHPEAQSFADDDEVVEAFTPEPSVQQARADEPKVGRNEPCPCGSGKKYKHCHGQLA